MHKASIDGRSSEAIVQSSRKARSNSISKINQKSSYVEYASCVSTLVLNNIGELTKLAEDMHIRVVFISQSIGGIGIYLMLCLYPNV